MSVLSCLYRCLATCEAPTTVRISAKCSLCLCTVEVYVPPIGDKPAALHCPCGCTARELKILAAQVVRP